MAGDCYQANGNFIIEKMGDKQFKLCHGVALLASDRKPYGHCWIEKGSMVMDFSNGKKLALPKKKYYKLGGIPVKGYPVYRYSGKEAATQMVKLGHWGPWESKPPR